MHSLTACHARAQGPNSVSQGPWSLAWRKVCTQMARDPETLKSCWLFWAQNLQKLGSLETSDSNLKPSHAVCAVPEWGTKTARWRGTDASHGGQTPHFPKRGIPC